MQLQQQQQPFHGANEDVFHCLQGLMAVVTERLVDHAQQMSGRRRYDELITSKQTDYILLAVSAVAPCGFHRFWRLSVRLSVCL